MRVLLRHCVICVTKRRNALDFQGIDNDATTQGLRHPCVMWRAVASLPMNASRCGPFSCENREFRGFEDREV